ncbi:shikimate dehydrogenase family protein [Thalassococcus lentus]|uniref:Shikimate dehydrogenase n=1 Tax=Thalassococcus lentus TaxID=1210524 RepID=A0ABT4XWP3_9RHOB|nr:shikimate dehydrogenase [Thalassococcus lentus]MDA7426223.1 shikimate dehydrogenase [Thalassococcus lentus]
MQDTRPTDLKLGLIGDKIATSKAPLLHRLAGQHAGITVQYDRLVPPDMDLSFQGVLEHARTSGYRGVNVTYPYKERAAALVHVPDPAVAQMGAVNTIVFSPSGPVGYNTDYSGFVQAFEHIRDIREPGTVCLIGTGGVGKAVAFALVTLGANSIRCVDADIAKARLLATSLKALNKRVKVEVFDHAEHAAKGADGLINCTPLGMEGDPRSPLERTAMSAADWAFDAVYTPVKTPFLTNAQAENLKTISGLELFFGQGFDAWHLFSGRMPDREKLRADVLVQSPSF